MNWPPIDRIPDLSDHQRDELAKALRGPLAVLAGRPGVGKTFVLARLLSVLPQRRVAVCGPTGKSAVRITESLAKAGVMNLTAKTIHSLLRVKSTDGGSWEFEHDEENPLPVDYIFCDESSMVGTGLMASLMAARPAGCNVLFVGDPGQLSPVEHGAPLRDLISAGMPCGQLTEIRRNSGRIVRACHAIADHGRYEPAKALDIANGENLIHVERGQPEGQIEELKGLLERLRVGGKYDPIWGCQVLVPLNDKGPLCRKVINKLLQGLLNPNGEQAEGNKFRTGDKAVNLQNAYLPRETPRDRKRWGKFSEPEAKEFVANGEIGRVEQVTPTYTVIRLENPDRLVRVPKGNTYQTEEGDTADTGCNWDLAYGLSVHKSQGSEFPVVVVLVDSQPGAIRLATKEFYYTALSRAKDICITIGQKRLVDSACKKSGLWQRKTFLRETIEGLRVQSVSRAWEQDLLEV